MAEHHWAGYTRRGHLPPDWSTRVVPRIMARDNGICYKCGLPGADAIDHIRPGNDHRDINLAAIHQNVPPYCHRYKTAAEGNAARAQRRIALRHPGERHPGAR